MVELRADILTPTPLQSIVQIMGQTQQKLGLQVTGL